MNDPIRFTLADGLDLAGADLDELWWRYIAIGGESNPRLLAERIRGSAPCDLREYSLIAQAINECFVDQGLNTFPVGYQSPQPAWPEREVLGSAVLSNRRGSGPGRIEARRRAAEARVRSAEAARCAAQLHLTAARLMQTSGQLSFARHARQRADDAQARASRAATIGW